MSPSMLVIDDDDAIASYANRFMAGDGWRIDVIRDLAEAAESVARRRYDAVLLDVALTGTTIAQGVGLVATIRRLQPQSKIVVLTGFGSDGVMCAASRGGADLFLHKPLSFNDLDGELHKLLDPPSGR